MTWFFCELTDEHLELMARAHDREDAAQRGEPSPWDLDFEGEADFQEFRSDRLCCMREAVEALKAVIFNGQEIRHEPRQVVGQTDSNWP